MNSIRPATSEPHLPLVTPRLNSSRIEYGSVFSTTMPWLERKEDTSGAGIPLLCISPSRVCPGVSTVTLIGSSMQ
ncbi:hypothetical protein D3C84_1211620 [compost metagenome]